MILPVYVNAVTDRHGKTRYRFRKAGLPSRYVPHPDDPSFATIYLSCLEGADASRQTAAHKTRKKLFRKAALKGTAVVYFVGISNGLVKIGTTVDLPGRLKKLQTGCPFDMQLLAVTPGGPDVEGEYHRRFAKLRIRGEWFKGHPIRAEIKRLQSADWCPTYYPGLNVQPSKTLK